MNLVSLESHDEIEYHTGKYFEKRRIKVEKNEDTFFLLFLLKAADYKFWSQKLQSFLDIKM